MKSVNTLINEQKARSTESSKPVVRVTERRAATRLDVKPTLEGYHVLLLQVLEQLLDGLVAAQRGGRAHHQQLVLGPGDGHVQAAPVLQQLAQLQVKGRGRSVTHTSSGSFHTKKCGGGSGGSGGRGVLDLRFRPLQCS